MAFSTIKLGHFDSANLEQKKSNSTLISFFLFLENVKKIDNCTKPIILFDIQGRGVNFFCGFGWSLIIVIQMDPVILQYPQVN